MGDISGAQRFGFYLPTSHSVSGLSELAPPGGRLLRERLDVARGPTVETGEEPHWPEDMDGEQFAAGLAGSALGYLGLSYRPGLPPFNSAYTLQEALTSREQHGEAQAVPVLAPGGPGQRASSRGPVSNPAPVLSPEENCVLGTNYPPVVPTISSLPLQAVGCVQLRGGKGQRTSESRLHLPSVLIKPHGHTVSPFLWGSHGSSPSPQQGSCERGQQSPALWAQDGAVCEKWLL